VDFVGRGCWMIFSTAGGVFFVGNGRRQVAAGSWFQQATIDLVIGSAHWIAVGCRRQWIPLVAAGGGGFCWPRVLDDFVGSGRRLVSAATGGNGWRLVLTGSGGLSWQQPAVGSGLLLVVDDGQFHWAAGSLIFLLICCMTNITLKLILIIISL